MSDISEHEDDDDRPSKPPKDDSTVQSTIDRLRQKQAKRRTEGGLSKKEEQLQNSKAVRRQATSEGYRSAKSSSKGKSASKQRKSPTPPKKKEDHWPIGRIVVIPDAAPYDEADGKVPDRHELDKLDSQGLIVMANDKDDLVFGGSADPSDVVDFVAEHLPKQLFDRLAQTAKNWLEDEADEVSPFRLGIKVNKTTLTISDKELPNGADLYYACVDGVTAWRSRTLYLFAHGPFRLTGEDENAGEGVVEPEPEPRRGVKHEKKRETKREAKAKQEPEDDYVPKSSATKKRAPRDEQPPCRPSSPARPPRKKTRVDYTEPVANSPLGDIENVNMVDLTELPDSPAKSDKVPAHEEADDVFSAASFLTGCPSPTKQYNFVHYSVE
ncbi:hypothetical protein EXIGLDRAFT_766247 [Exidia glandulosa HHB12029]|uniref:Uncharacterized protein n=1 Tax=Exidia glandulosa HHB12029 TaxID=1314781 RepID=A0A165JWJ1_EXIGL|nr:hypothetical protein EXIGLDRAFT_766247 [Exidia glandulosa HHB12029]